MIKDSFESKKEWSKEDSHEEGPKPLLRSLDESERFPLECLGDILEPAARALIESVQAPDAICAQSLLAGSALALQPFADVVNDGRVSPISLFFLTVGASGERKTAVDKEVLKSHQEVEAENIRGYDRGKFRAEAANDAWTHSRAEILRKNKSASQEDVTKLLEELGPPPPPHIAPISLIQEPTYEGLVKQVSFGRPSVGLFSDEGGRFIGGHGMKAEEQLKTAAGFSELWDGKPITRVRAGDGSSKVYGKRLSMHLMVQPIVANQMLGNSVLVDQGLLSRFLVSYPTSTVGTRQYKQINLNDDQRIVLYRRVMREICSKRLPLAEDTVNELKPSIMRLSEDASRAWINFHNLIEKEMADGRKFRLIRGFASKIAEQALRMASVLSMMDDLENRVISETVMQRSIFLMHYYLNETLRLFNQAVVDPDMILAEKLKDWLLKKNLKFVYLVQVYQTGPNQIREKATAEKIIDILVDHAWLKKSDSMVLDGKHRKLVWEVMR